MRILAHSAAAALLLTLLLAAVPSATAVEGCWYTETTRQEVLAVGADSVYLEVEQKAYSAACDPQETQPAVVYCAGAAPGEDQTYPTPPVVLPEVRVLGITVVEEGDGVPSQDVPVPGSPDLAYDDHDECRGRPVLRLVVDSQEDTVVGSDGTVQPGGVPLVGTLLGICAEAGDAETCQEAVENLLAGLPVDPSDPDIKDVTALLLPGCFTPEGKASNLCYSGGGITGARFQFDGMGFSI